MNTQPAHNHRFVIRITTRTKLARRALGNALLIIAARQLVSSTAALREKEKGKRWAKSKIGRGASYKKYTGYI